MICKKSFQLSGEWSSRKVWLNGELLQPNESLKVINHSPDGFAWGYGGSGPSQLALAICLKLFGDKGQRFYQSLKWNHISTLPQKNFNIRIDFEYND